MQGLRLITEDERLTYADYAKDGFEIYYRRIPNHIRGAIVKRHTRVNKRGNEIVDWVSVSEELFDYAVIGWKGVYIIENGKRKDVDFSPDVIRNTPDEIQAEIIELAGGNVETTEGDIKNSSSTPDSKAKTMA